MRPEHEEIVRRECDAQAGMKALSVPVMKVKTGLNHKVTVPQINWRIVEIDPDLRSLVDVRPVVVGILIVNVHSKAGVLAPGDKPVDSVIVVIMIRKERSRGLRIPDGLGVNESGSKNAEQEREDSGAPHGGSSSMCRRVRAFRTPIASSLTEFYSPQLSRGG
jgi:hypothetical protein